MRASPLLREVLAGLVPLAVLVASALHPAPAEAQGVPQVAVSDDAQWETRREPWDGGPIRPGGELDGKMSGWVWTGAVALIGGYALSFVGFDPRTASIIPLVGPWLSAAGVVADSPWEDGQTIAMVISGILQVGGVLAIILGALNPRYYVVYDAPVGSPSLSVTWAPGAAGADVGSSLRVDF